MICGVNLVIKSPVAYYFIDSLKTESKKKLLMDVLQAVSATGVTILNITSDGLVTNLSVFEKLGANFADFKPSFKNPFSNNDIHVIQDPCHMLKLVRNTLADREILYDSENNKIEWKYFVKLETIGKSTIFNQTHKITKRHIHWKERIMHVGTAAETLSNHIADAIQFLMEMDVPGFTNAAATIKFCKIINDTFDIMNSFRVDEQIGLKSALNPSNQEKVFDKFREVQNYILNLNVRKSKENPKIVSVLQSDRKTAFRGFLINIISIEKIYRELVDEKQWASHFATYTISQDHLEILFGKLRLMSGCNDNPTQQQFSAAMRKQLFQSELNISSKANVHDFEPVNDAICSSILNVSSRPKINSPVKSEHNEQPRLYENEGPSAGNEWKDILNEAGITFIAYKLEKSLLTCGQIYCQTCKEMLENNIRVDSRKCLPGRQPTKGSYNICKTTDNIMKQFAGKSNIKTEVTTKVLSLLDTQTLYASEFDAEHDMDHVDFIIKFIIDGFVRITQDGFAKMKTLGLQNSFLRQNARNNVHFSGQ